MYLPYLMFGYAATVVLMVAGCYAISRTLPGLPGLRLLIGALFCGLGGVLLLASRPFAPAWATIVVANGMIFLCSFLIYCATAEILNVPTFGSSWGTPVLGAALAGLLYFTYVHQSLTARIYICSGCFAVYAAARSVILFAHREPVADEVAPPSALHPLIAALAWLQVAIVAVQVGRVVLTALYPPVEIVHMDVIQAGATYLNLVLNAGAGFGLIWLAQALHRRELHRMAQTDSLTGLLNRRAFEEILARELRRSQHAATPLAILLVDIDRFKNVNDTWGHQAGDVVIRRVALALRDNLRPGDPLSRFGGEEFLILLRDATTEQSAEVAERICANIAALAGLPGSIQLTVSIGVALSHLADTPEELLRRCDEAMYLSKKGGRNLVTVDRSVVHHADPAPAQISAQTAGTYS
jgi:diguanylate cyclase (GGDEF)-like protein